jgi:hypothetical protein
MIGEEVRGETLAATVADFRLYHFSKSQSPEFF